ncbi:DUF1700 domain-containing protein [Gimesia panareensis]|uniref:Uncharacterized protein n=1 Tax=Gimesia panareensis TaxID=2527978 RepID=A0A518AB47_9PLAN|nr:hypothetical protein [Gimesia panareensis]QDT29072.1 hypothetical protein Enr10x_44210 [Gimesia panareensis]QDU51924.1 hypothetical protein Pan110_42940 [Gimesia panareensis]
MSWPEISVDDFPPRRDDEPSSLRQDIIDELSDHFVCALNRELHKNPDEQVAKRRVLEQFGDPIKIARQLWLDAMKEKMMSQRILTGMSVVMAACCIAVVGIAWSMMQESRAFNLQMLEQFKQAQERSAGETSGDLHLIQFQLVRDGSQDQPAVGFAGALAKYEGNNAIFTVEAVSDEKGLLDFGKLPWGEYALNLKAPWGEAPSPVQITTVPGRKYEQTIVCPAHAPQQVEVELQVNWKDRPEDEVYLLCDFRSLDLTKLKQGKYFELKSFQEIQDRKWIFQHDTKEESEYSVYLIDVSNDRATRCPLAADGNYKNLDPQQLAWHPTVEILQGEYKAPTVYLLEKSDLEQLTTLNPMIATETIAFDIRGFNLRAFAFPSNGLFVSPFRKLEIDPALVVDKTPAELKKVHGFFANSYDKTYDATDQEPNVWEINIPDLFPVTRESGSLSSVR